MNRVLSWPHTPIVPGLIDSLKAGRHDTTVTDKGMIRFDLALGPVEMKFCNPQQQLAPGTEVQVWWKGGGFVCARTRELQREERASRHIADSLDEARSRLAAARRDRQARLAAQADLALRAEPEPKEFRIY
ncbi:MAG TPA: hypothetical protein VGE16_08070 [Albitalea sp.]